MSVCFKWHLTYDRQSALQCRKSFGLFVLVTNFFFSIRMVFIDSYCAEFLRGQVCDIYALYLCDNMTCVYPHCASCLCLPILCPQYSVFAKWAWAAQARSWDVDSLWQMYGPIWITNINKYFCSLLYSKST
jgi:hypothetical protein